MSDIAAKFPKFQLLKRSSRGGNKYIGPSVNMLDSAKPDCQVCFSTGWACDWDGRCMVRCTCTDPTEVVYGS